MTIRRTRSRTASPAATAALATALVALAGPTAAQHHDHGHHAAMPTDGVRAELIHTLDGVADKYLSLLDAMAPHMAWRPADGVRSTAEVFSHVAAGNFMIATMAGGTLPEGMTMDDVRAMGGLTDRARIRENLSHSFRHLQHTIASMTDAALDEPATLFGRETTKRAVLLLLATHAHEHLGQAIAYARVNGVTPPWTAARQ